MLSCHEIYFFITYSKEGLGESPKNHFYCAHGNNMNNTNKLPKTGK